MSHDRSVGRAAQIGHRDCPEAGRRRRGEKAPAGNSVFPVNAMDHASLPLPFSDGLGATDLETFYDGEITGCGGSPVEFVIWPASRRSGLTNTAAIPRRSGETEESFRPPC